MYGMSAKDRMAMFENNTNGPKKGSSGPKKIGKLKVSNGKPAEEPKKAVPKKPKTKENKEVKKETSETPKEEPVKQEKKEAADVKSDRSENNEKAIQSKKGDTSPKKEEAKEKIPEKKSEQEPEPQLKEDDKQAESKPIEPTAQAKEIPKTEAAQDVKKEEAQPAKIEDVKPTQEAVIKEDIKEQPANKDLKPPVEPSKKDVKAPAEPAKTDVKPTGEPAKKDVKPPTEPAKKDVKAPAEPAKKDVKAPAEPAKKDVKAPAEPAKKDVKPPAEPAKKDVKAPAEPVKKEDNKQVKQPSQKFDKRPSQPTKKEDLKEKEVPEKAGSKEQENKENETQVEQHKEAPVRKRRRPQYIPVPEEFYDTLFYFSGMGTVVGSAMNEGVYVPQRATKTALEAEVIDKVEVEKEKEREQDTFMIRTARTQALNIAEELRKLHGLLNGLPNFGGQESDLHKIDVKPVDTIMHAKYHNFQQVAQTAPRVKPVEVPKQQIPKPVTQWPPPIEHPKPQKESPISIDIVSPAQIKPVPITGKDKNVGVFKGVPGDKPSQDDDKSSESGSGRPYGVYTAKPEKAIQAWQDKYGDKSVEDLRAPQPYQQEGEIPSGLKPWQLSRLRGLEARGYQFAHYEPQSGADHSDSFYHGTASLELEDMKLSSLAPFLVSGKSQIVDRVQQEGMAPVTSATFSLKKHTGFGQHGEDIPYCDL